MMLMDVQRWVPFDRKTLNKYLAGKKANVSFSVNNYTDVLNGYSTVKDLTTLMELVYTSFTALTADQETYDVEISRLLPMLESRAKRSADYLLPSGCQDTL